MARAVAREGDTLLVEAIDREAAPVAQGSPKVSVLRDLPDVNRSVGRVLWAPSRAMTYMQRAHIRRRHWVSGDFDLFHVHYLNRYTDVVARLPGPLVMSVHDAIPHVPRLGTALEHGLLKRLYSRPDALVVHHQSVAAQLTDSFNVSAERITVVPYPVLTRIENPMPPPEGPPTVLLFGSLRPNKGLEVLGEAMRILAGRDLRIVIAGRGHSELERMAHDLQARDSRISAEIGFISLRRKTELFHQASVVALPYTSFSSQSAVLHDAYGYGRPVIVSDVGALGATVADDGTGLVTPPGDAKSLAHSITALLDRSTWEVASAACASVAAKRSPAAFGHGLRSIYERLLE